MLPWEGVPTTASVCVCVCDPYAAGPGANVQDEEGTDAHDHQHSNDNSPVGGTSPTTTRLPQLLRVRPSLWHIDLLLALHARLLVVLLATCMRMQLSRLIHSLTTETVQSAAVDHQSADTTLVFLFGPMLMHTLRIRQLRLQPVHSSLAFNGQP